MSIMFETLERLEKENGEVSASFAEVWSLVQEKVSEEPQAPVEPSGLNNLLTMASSGLPKAPSPEPIRAALNQQQASQRPRVSWRDTLDAGRAAAAALRNTSRYYPKTLAMVVAGVTILAAMPTLRAMALPINRSWQQVRQAMLDRAPVALDADFRTGHENWIGRGNAPASSWSFDSAGFAHPGRLALYRPSLALADYQLEFQGMIDKKALSWVVRAVDFDNYYVVKLTVLKPGPLPALGLTRYAVIGGKIQNRVTTPLVTGARADTIYRVRLDVHDENFVLSVQDQTVDRWAEPQLRRGGIGFFSDDNAKSRVIGVKVTGRHGLFT